MSIRRRRGMTPEDRELWTFVTRDVEPLKRRRRKIVAADTPAKTEEPPAAKPVKAAAASPAKVPAPKPRIPSLPPIAAIDRHERKQVVRGTRPIESRIDLHGMRQAEAHGALRSFLAYAQSHGHSMVLVITGKGARGAESSFSFDDERGILRRVVPQWLRMPDLRPFVVGFEEAHHGHGGSGALYVRLRRSKGRAP